MKGGKYMMRKIRRIRRAIEYAGLRLMHWICSPASKMLYGGKKIWLISERGDDARDNAFFFYKYVREQHPEQQAYFVIKKSSPDYARVAALGGAVRRGSIRHWMLHLATDVKISTHINVSGLVPGRHWRYERYLSGRNKREKYVFLQHGITKDDMIGLHKEKAKIDLFICGAKPEYEYILSAFHYTEDEAKYTGFARFDRLHGCQTKRQVLIMPTWREWLSPNFNFHATKHDIQNVKNSRYIQAWKSLIGSDRLQKLAQEYHVSFVFYPHYEMQPYLKFFAQENSCVTIADFAHYDVQTLLQESMMLITDYSSVFFDFAYMKKPTVFYQFDEDEYRARHYRQGYFDYRRDGFGEVVMQEELLLDIIEQYIKQDCCMKSEYMERVGRFFPLHDEKNCERIYYEIKRIAT